MLHFFADVADLYSIKLIYLMDSVNASFEVDMPNYVRLTLIKC